MKDDDLKKDLGGGGGPGDISINMAVLDIDGKGEEGVGNGCVDHDLELPESYDGAPSGMHFVACE